MRLIVAVFVLGEDMEDMEDVLKLCLGLWWEVFWKERFVWNVDFVEILKNKWDIGYFLACLSRGVC